MEKYATYAVYQHKGTKEIKRIPFTNEEELVKIANTFGWDILDSDPEDLNEDKRHEDKKGT